MRNLMIHPNRIGNDFDRIVNAFFGDKACRAGNHSEREVEFSPRVNIVDYNDNVSLTFELPGLDKADIKVVVADGMLTVSGNRKLTQETKDEHRVRSEIRTGSFSRSFSLPESVNAEDVKADYKNGLLEVKLPKKEELKPKEINVDVS